MFDPNSQQSTFNQVDDKAKQYMNNPQALQDMYQQKQQLIDLLALQKIKSQKEAAAREMQLQMAQQSGQPKTIAQQREQQVLDMTKQEMVQQQAGNLGQQQQEQQQNLQQVLQGMSQGAPQPPQQGTPGVPQGEMPSPQAQAGGLPSLPTPGMMPPKAMASGGIVAFDDGGDVSAFDNAPMDNVFVDNAPMDNVFVDKTPMDGTVDDDGMYSTMGNTRGDNPSMVERGATGIAAPQSGISNLLQNNIKRLTDKRAGRPMPTMPQPTQAPSVRPAPYAPPRVNTPEQNARLQLAAQQQQAGFNTRQRSIAKSDIDAWFRGEHDKLKALRDGTGSGRNARTARAIIDYGKNFEALKGQRGKKMAELYAKYPNIRVTNPENKAEGGAIGYDEGGIIGYDKGGAIEEWEEEYRRRQAELEDPNRATSWAERNIYSPKEAKYKQKRDAARSELYKQNAKDRPGPLTPTTEAERKAYEAKEAIIKNLGEGKYDPTGKPLVPMIGKEKQSDVFARMESMNKDLQKPPMPDKQGPAPVENPLQKVLNKTKLAQQLPQAEQQAPGSALQRTMETAATKQVNRDPVEEAKAKRAEAAAALGYTPEERAKFDANQAAMEAFDKSRFDPERMRDEQLTDFLLNAAGRSTMGSTLAAAGRGGENTRRQQLAMQREAMGERQMKQEGLLELDRKGREKGFELGEKAGEQTEMGTRQGLASGTAMVDADKEVLSRTLDRASREKIANLEAQVRREVNAASKEGTLEIRRQTLIANIDKAEETAVSTATKSSPAYATLKNLSAMESYGKLDKEQMAKKQSAEADLDKLTLAIRNKFQDTRTMVMSGNSDAGLGSLSTGGFKVTPIKK